MVSFTEFLSNNVIWAYVILGIFGLTIVYAIIHYLYFRRKNQDETDDLRSEKELKDALKSLENQKKIKAEVKANKEIKPKKEIKKEIQLVPERIKLIDSKGKTVLEDKLFYFEAKPHSYFKKRKWYHISIIFTRAWKEKRLIRKFPHKTVLVRMEMNNGTHREFLVKDDASGFTYNKARYVFDIETRYWIVDSLIWAYDFHESISLSIKIGLKPVDELVDYIKQLESNSRQSIHRKIPINELKETIEQSGISQVENSINPIVLERVIKSEIIQAILQGSALGRLFRVLLIIVIIILFAVALDVVIDFVSSDLPNQLGITKGGGE